MRNYLRIFIDLSNQLNMNGLAVSGIISLIIYALLFNWTFCFLYLLVLCAYFLLSHIYTPVSAAKYNTVSSKTLISSFSDPDGPEVMGHFKVRINNALEFINKIREKTGKRITITHLVVKIAGLAIKEFPDLNGKLSFGCFKPYENCAISCLVAIDEGKDLGILTYTDTDTRSLISIADEAENRVSSLKTGEERQKHKKATGSFVFIPACVGGILIEIVAFVTVALGISIPMLNLKKHPAGGMLISNVGEMGVEMGYAPMPCVVRANLLVALSTIKDEIVVVDGRIQVEKVMGLLGTFDHRYGDGTRVAQAENKIKQMLENPEAYLTE